MSLSFFQTFLRHRAASARIFALMVIYIAICFLEPLFYKVFVDEVVLKSNLTLLVVLCAAMGGWALVHAYLKGLTKYWRHLLGQRVVGDLRRALFDKLLQQSPAF